MTKLAHCFTKDTVFKMTFSKNPGLLKRLVATLLGIDYLSISKFVVTNSEMPPEELESKFCHLDINMRVDGRIVNLEIQVDSVKHEFIPRSLYHWAREYSSALLSGTDSHYSMLPETIVISIVDFPLFIKPEFYSKFQLVDISKPYTGCYEVLTEKCTLLYYELKKHPAIKDRDDYLGLWMALFAAKTEEDIRRIEQLEVPVMTQTIEAYRKTVTSAEFIEIEKARDKGRVAWMYAEAAALKRGEELGEARGEARSDAKWQAVVADKDALIASLQAQLGESVD